MSTPKVGRLLIGFIAGAVAVLTFHQGAVGLLHVAGAIDRAPYSMTPTQPLGVPAVLSAAFFGGLWGIVMLAVMRRPGLWSGLVFGAILPTAVGLFIVSPLKGLPLGGGWDMTRIGIGLLVNGAWGLGTVLIARGLARATPRRLSASIS